MHLAIPSLRSLRKAFASFLLCSLTSTAYSLTCSDVDGAYVYASNGTYLGFFGNQFAPDSIHNTFGSYGSQFQPNSMLNTFGTYGSQFQPLSATNSFATQGNVPILYKYGVAIAYVSANTFIPGSVSLPSLLACGSSSSSALLSEPVAVPIPGDLPSLAASQGTSSSVIYLEWSAADYATIYDVYVSNSPSGSLTFIGSTYSTFETITGAEPGTVFYYTVYPRNETGSGGGRYASGYVAAAVVASNEAPSVSISGGDQSVSDTDGVAGESVSISGSASDSDGSVASTSWSVNGSQVASGTSATLSLSDGSNTVTFTATDDDGDSAETSVTITVAAAAVVDVPVEEDVPAEVDAPVEEDVGPEVDSPVEEDTPAEVDVPVEEETPPEVDVPTAEALNNLDSVKLGELDVATIAALGADQVAELAADAISGLKADQLSSLAIDAVSGFDSNQVRNISVDSITGLNAEKMSNLTKEALSGFTADQFGALDAEALGGLKAENLGGLNADIFSTLTEENLTKLDVAEVKKLAGEDFSKLVTNLNNFSVSSEKVAELLPEGWKIDADGDLTAPPGAGLSFAELKKTAPTEGEALIAALPDFSKNLSLGGGSGDNSVLGGLDKGLEAANVAGVGFTQRADGVLNIGAVGEAPIAAFIPNTTKMVQAAVGAKVGVTLDEKTGGYVVITSQGYQIPLLPSLSNPTEVSKLLPNSTIAIGSGGQTSISNVEDENGVPATIAGIANPILETSDLAPGAYRSGSGAAAKIQIVYADGSAQTLKPAINDQAAFETAAKALGVEDIVFRVDGSVRVTLGGVDINLKPLFEIEEGAEGTKVKPEIKIEAGRYFVVSSNGDKQEFVEGS